MEERRHYTTVSANDTSIDEYAVSNGTKILVQEIGGNGCLDHNVKVEIFFDTTRIFSTHGDDHQTCNQTFTGDGSKKMKIKLTNDTSSSETLGGFYKYEEF